MGASLLFLAAIVAARSASFGSLPSKEKKATYNSSRHFNSAQGIFVNRRPEIIKVMRKRSMTLRNMSQHFLKASADATPKTVLPTVTPDFEAFQAPSDDLRVIWLGHSSLLLNFEGLMLLVDPVLAQRTGPLGFMMRRFQAPVVSPSELPPIDLILITHDHYDHLDMATIKAFKNQETRFLVPLGVSAHLRRWGIPEYRIQELDWWQTTSFKGLKLTATPSQHFSGRHLINQNQSLWASWVVKSSRYSVYFSGDSGYDSHFQEIGTAFGPFDVAFIESGQYSVLWPEMHLHPTEGLQAFTDLKAKRYFPIHWGMFRLSNHAWYEPIEMLSAAAQQRQIPLITPMMGEVAVLNAYEPSQAWWQPLRPASEKEL